MAPSTPMHDSCGCWHHRTDERRFDHRSTHVLGHQLPIRPTFYYLFLAHLLIWIPLDYILLLSVQKSPLPFSFLMFLMAWFCRELSVYLVFISALSNPTHIKWGRHMYKVHFGGLTTRLNSNHRSTIKHDHRDDSDKPKSTTRLVNDYASSDSTSMRLSTPSTMIHLWKHVAQIHTHASPTKLGHFYHAKQSLCIHIHSFIFHSFSRLSYF